MAILKIGHYPINSNTASHTYAIMEFNGNNYYFNCYGGTNDSGNEFPVNYYKPKNIFYTRGGSVTDYTQLDCNPYVAILLASWGSSVDYNRYVYNLKSGGYSGLGDNAGIVYGLTGLCHQMCNTITCATNTATPMDALINWPRSLSSSKIIYGNRGSCGHSNAIEKLMNRISSYIPNMVDTAIQLDTLPLDDIFAPINDELNAELKETLTNGVAREERMLFVEEAADRNDVNIEAILDVDMQVAAVKNELDNLLIRDSISHQEYADRMNAYTRSLLERYRDVLQEDKFNELFGGSIDEIDCNIVDPDMMPESYAEIRKNIKLD